MKSFVDKQLEDALIEKIPLVILTFSNEKVIRLEQVGDLDFELTNNEKGFIKLHNYFYNDCLLNAYLDKNIVKNIYIEYETVDLRNEPHSLKLNIPCNLNIVKLSSEDKNMHLTMNGDIY